MTVRRVLYALQLNQETKTKLKIVSFKKVNSKGRKSNVYFVEFATLADAELAAKQCRRLGHMTLKEYLPHSAHETSTKQSAPSESIPHLTDKPPTILSSLSTPTAFRKANERIPSVRHVSSELAPNSSMVRTLMDVLRSCLTVIETAQKSAERTRTPHGMLYEQRNEVMSKILPFFRSFCRAI
jgi:hypothetical protein